MYEESRNRWGDPEKDDGPLPVDEWFPSEKTHDSEDMESLSRGFVPVGILIGIILAIVCEGMLDYAFRTPERNAILALSGGAVGAWALTFLIPYGTLVYYAIKKQVLLGRRDRRLPVDIVPEDIEEYTVPLHMVPGTGRLWMGALNSGRKTAPLGMRRARVATYVVAGLFFVAIAVLVLLTR